MIFITFRSNEDSSASRYDRNVFCIWYYDDDISENIRSEMRNRLNTSFTYVRIFNDLIEFITYLTQPLVVTKIFFIITGKNAQYLCNVARNRFQYETVYQFQLTASLANTSSVFTDMNELFIQISKDLEAYSNKNQSLSATETSSTNYRESVVPPPWSIWNSKITESSFRGWNIESPEFFLFQALTRILTQLKCDHDRSLAEMFAECRLYYITDTIEVKKVDDVKHNYKATDAILHYTRDSFLFRLVGRAFRSEDFERIFIFRRYIIDLHCELIKLTKGQETLQKIFRLYRGKKLRTAVLQQLQDNVGALLSMNGFLSTTYNQKTALEIFAGAGEDRPEYESVLFEFCIDEETMNRTYADISNISQFPSEEEVLFTIGSIWRIDCIQKNDNFYWIVKLSSCNDVDSRILRFFEELTDDSTLLMLGNVLRELGQHTKAENFYNKMLNESTIKNETRVILYYNIAMINIAQNKDFTALTYLKEAEKLISTIVINVEPLNFQGLYSASNIPSSIHIFNNMGCLYAKEGDPTNALQYFTKALDVEPSDRIDKATVHDNVGLLHFSHEDYQTALEHLFEAIRLAQDHSSLPKFKQHYEAVNKHLQSKNNSSDTKPNDFN